MCAAEGSKRQGRILDEYRFRFDAKRRELARTTVQKITDRIEPLLAQLVTMTEGWDASKPMPEPEWNDLQQAVKSIDTILGSSVRRGGRWDMLNRHLHFGLKGDLNDILSLDWPSVKVWLEKALYGPGDPLPIAIRDVAELVLAEPTGSVATELRWDKLSPEDFERLIYNIFSGATGYENPKWLMHTNAPDRGRDLSVERVRSDTLMGSQRQRVIVACKHWQTRSVSVDELGTLKNQMSLWEPPRVDVLIVATSGRFTQDAVQWAERHNQANEALHIDLWPDSHLERLLAERPC